MVYLDEFCVPRSEKSIKIFKRKQLHRKHSIKSEDKGKTITTYISKIFIAITCKEFFQINKIMIIIKFSRVILKVISDDEPMV